MLDIPICIDCEHLDRAATSLVCQAYPGGIPDEILEGEADHTKPFPGDNGIQFKKREKTND